METWYEVSRHRNTIEPVEVVSRTACYLTVKKKRWYDGNDTFESREKINTSYTKYFPTLEQAKEVLLNRAEREVECAKQQLSKAKSQLGTIKKLIETGEILRKT